MCLLMGDEDGGMERGEGEGQGMGGGLGIVRG